MKADEMTGPSWDRYRQDLARHEKFCDDYLFFLHRMLRHLEWWRPAHTWTTAEIKELISNEIEKSRSMDAPNKPGYYRANND